MRYFIALTLILLTSCTGIPKGIQPVDNFELNRYLGDWYEIARLDHSFERGLSNVKANYSLQADGRVKVINRGYLAKNKEWKEAEGKAYFVEEDTKGYLKVSFFGPFYGSYVIFKLDQQNYEYAFVTSYNKNYLWLLSRSPAVSEATRNDFINTAKDLGFNTEEIIFVTHNSPAPE